MQNLIERLGIGDSTGALMLWIGLGVLMLVAVLALATWLIRTLRPTLNLSGSSGRGGRPQRLAITDAFTLDRDGRKLVIIRRDNVEHLLLIGGPNDVLVEPNIVRSERAVRGRAPSDIEALQAVESALTGDPGPQAPPPPPPAVAPPPAPRASAPPPPPRAPANPISQPASPSGAAPRLDDEFERALSAMQQQVTQRHQAAPAQRATAPVEPPAPAPPQGSAPNPSPAQAPAPRPAPAPPAAAAVAPPALPVLPDLPPMPPAPASPRSEPMSEMARRLNEVLQKPMSGSLRPPFNKPIPPVPPVSQQPQRPMPPPPPPTPAPMRPAQPPVAEPAPLAQESGQPLPAIAAADMDMLEEEMARLLGRPGDTRKPDPS